MGRVAFDYSKINGMIKEKFGTQKAFAKALGVSNTSLSLKLNSNAYFTQKEIMKIVDIFSIPVGKIGTYFFTLKVQKIEQEV